MGKKLLKKMNTKRGQTSVEYILLVVVVVAAVMAFGKQLKTKLGDVTNQLFGGVSSSISNTLKE